jgi:hypothetical protein
MSLFQAWVVPSLFYRINPFASKLIFARRAKVKTIRLLMLPKAVLETVILTRQLPTKLQIERI